MSGYPELPEPAWPFDTKRFQMLPADAFARLQVYEAIDADRAMRANDAKDAARYRWLRDQHWVEPEATFRLGLVESEFTGAYHDALDAAIDAAMKA